MVQKSPHESLNNSRRDRNCTFKPEISRRAKSIKRSESVEARLYHDAGQRKKSQAIKEEKHAKQE